MCLVFFLCVFFLGGVVLGFFLVFFLISCLEKALWIKRCQSKYFNLQINNKDEKNHTN